MNEPKANSIADWYFVHSLATIAFAAVLTMFGARLYLDLNALKSINAPGFVRVLVAVGGIAACWLWIRMLVDFFRERPARSPVLWGWVLVIGAVVGGLAYFWFVWRPRNRPT
ncbi:MAG TPA: hypothetical protein VH814_17950 [Steroidobacteraceae bacterium]|jgi:hypothetical protein